MKLPSPPVSLGTPQVTQVGVAYLSQAAAPAQRAAGLAEVVVVPAGEGGDRTPDAVQVVQAAVVGQLSE